MKRYEPDLEGLKEEYLDAVLRAALRLQDEAQIKSLVEEGTRELTEEEEKAARSAWERAIGKYERQQAEKEKRERREKRRSFLCRIAASAACILLLAAVGTTIAAAASEPVRESLNRLLLCFGDGHVDISLDKTDKSDPEEGIIPGSDTVCVNVPEEWKGSYYPAYIPEGYELRSIYLGGKAVDFINSEGHSVSFTEYHENDSLGLNTEDVEVYEIKLSDSKRALVTAAEGYCAVVWSEGEVLLLVLADETLEEVMRIAENVRFIP